MPVHSANGCDAKCLFCQANTCHGCPIGYVADGPNCRPCGDDEGTALAPSRGRSVCATGDVTTNSPDGAVVCPPAVFGTPTMGPTGPQIHVWKEGEGQSQFGFLTDHQGYGTRNIDQCQECFEVDGRMPLEEIDILLLSKYEAYDVAVLGDDQHVYTNVKAFSTLTIGISGTAASVALSVKEAGSADSTADLVSIPLKCSGIGSDVNVRTVDPDVFVVGRMFPDDPVPVVQVTGGSMDQNGSPKELCRASSSECAIECSESTGAQITELVVEYVGKSKNVEISSTNAISVETEDLGAQFGGVRSRLKLSPLQTSVTITATSKGKKVNDATFTLDCSLRTYQT